MNAQELVASLQGRWHGRYGMARCPAHEDRDPSLSVTDGEDGRTLVKCHAGCSQDAVQDALRARGLWGNSAAACASIRPVYGLKQGGRPLVSPQNAGQPKPRQIVGVSRKDDAIERTAAALEIWRASDAVVPDDRVTAYLRARGINIPIPPSLRYAQACKYTPSGLFLPAMVAAVQASNREIVAVHRCYLDMNLPRKAQVLSPKMALGPIGDGAVRLAAAGRETGVAEGVETALSAMQLFDVPVWAALGSRLDKVALPFTVEHVVIFADNGSQGREAAEKAAERFTGEGRKVTLRSPPEGDGDWNDTLRAGR